jgi:hypothetical protein
MVLLSGGQGGGSWPRRTGHLVGAGLDGLVHGGRSSAREAPSASVEHEVWGHEDLLLDRHILSKRASSSCSARRSRISRASAITTSSKARDRQTIREAFTGMGTPTGVVITAGNQSNGYAATIVF